MDSGEGREGGVGFSIGFITALVSDELTSCEEQLGERGWTEVPASPYFEDAGIRQWSKNLKGTQITAYSTSVGRMGQVAAALQTFAFMSRCRPTDVFLTGIAGSLKQDRVFKADVVVATTARWRTQNRIYDGTTGCDEYRAYNQPHAGLSVDLSLRVQRFVADRYPVRHRESEYRGEWNVMAGEVFTWDYVLDSSRVAARIASEFPEALCVEMEGGGFLAAVERSAAIAGGREQRGFVVKGISDYAARKDKVPEIRRAASRNAARVAIDLAEHLSETRIARLRSGHAR